MQSKLDRELDLCLERLYNLPNERSPRLISFLLKLGLVHPPTIEVIEGVVWLNWKRGEDQFSLTIPNLTEAYFRGPSFTGHISVGQDEDAIYLRKSLEQFLSPFKESLL